MKRTVVACLLALWLLPAAFAQDSYPGPKPDVLFTAPAERAFLAEFNEKFNANLNAPAQYAKAQTLNLDAWEMDIFDARKAELTFYQSYPQAGAFSAAFKTYVEACIRWNYWHLLLAYPIVRGNAQTAQPRVASLPAVMLENFDEKKVSDDAALSAEPYRNFLLYYVTYFNSKARNWAKYTAADLEKNLGDKADFARQHLTGKPYQYVLARLMLENCDKATPSTARAVFGLLSATPGAEGYATAVKAHCGDVMSRKEDPKPATVAVKKTKEVDPNKFSFTNTDGEPVTLDEFKGKVVYLDVWASWCGPCRAEFPFSKQLHERLTEKQKKQIVFLYLSIDDTEAAWKNALTALKLPGDQGWSKGGWKSRVVQYFGIQSIPRYILIDKRGNVTDESAKRPSSGEAIWNDLMTLVNQ